MSDNDPHNPKTPTEAAPGAQETEDSELRPADESDRLAIDALDDFADADLMDNLEAWFESPATSMLPAPESATGKPENALTNPWEVYASSEELEARAAAKERALEAVEPAFVDAVQDRGAQAAAMIKQKRAPITPLEDIHQFELARWRLRLAAPPQERVLPREIDDILRQNTPQATLRDLYRPEPQVEHVQFEYHHIDTSAVTFAQESIKAEYRASRSICADQDRTGHAALQQARTWLRNTPWDTCKPENPRPATFTPDPELLKYLDS